jgi:cytoskeletal protein CcmA (bactofilin family)
MASLESTLVNSIVGTGTFFKGTIVVTGLLRVDGDFRGAIQTDGRVIIGRGGRADCTIDAATVVIGGVFRGTIYAREKVIALESAIVTGNIYSPRLVAESGVVLDGALHIKRSEEPKSSGKPIPEQIERDDQGYRRKRRVGPGRSGGRRKIVSLAERDDLDREDQT